MRICIPPQNALRLAARGANRALYTERRALFDRGRPLGRKVGLLAGRATLLHALPLFHAGDAGVLVPP